MQPRNKREHYVSTTTKHHSSRPIALKSNQRSVAMLRLGASALQRGIFLRGNAPPPIVSTIATLCSAARRQGTAPMDARCDRILYASLHERWREAFCKDRIGSPEDYRRGMKVGDLSWVSQSLALSAGRVVICAEDVVEEAMDNLEMIPLEASSTLKKRRLKMNKHKYRKRRKRDRRRNK